MTTLLCSFNQLIFPKSPNPESNGYMVGIYNVHETLLDASGAAITKVKVVGHYLPTVKGIKYDITGQWAKDKKHGTQYKMESFHEVIPPTRTGIITFLSSGLVHGIGPKMAEKIYDKFGDDTIDVFENHPDLLKSISGISDNKLEKIRESYLASRDSRDIVAFLAPYGVTPARAIKIHREYGGNAINIVRENPYKLCEMQGVGFITADKIAFNMGIERTSDFRIDAGILQTLKDAENEGHLCLKKPMLCKQCVKLLDTEDVDINMVNERATAMISDARLTTYLDYIYNPSTASIEKNVASSVHELLSFGPVSCPNNLDAAIDSEERRLGIKLAPEQRLAVKTCLTSRISIVSGGPGTGKTLIQRFVLDIFTKWNADAKVICCAPTGRAARRMEECSGFPASTIHKALKLVVGDNGYTGKPEPLDADLVLADEVSMLDIYLANHLLNSIERGKQLILVGDVDQLPSVGPGAVLSELIVCGQIPVVKLDKVFRQNSGSRIAINAKLIRHNNLSLDYGDDFQFIESKEFSDSAEIIEKLYQSEVGRVGLDNVALLTPLRTRTDTGVNSLNARLQEVVNPAATHKPEVVSDKGLFRLGDRVMQTKNCGDVNNGDIGYIIEITTQDGEAVVKVDYGDERVAEYDRAGLRILDLAYASTIHKSQGSEYTTVIISLQDGHYIMLKRPLIYTAITRAKQRVYIVGDRRALCIAINTVDTEKRGTMLAARINDYYTAKAVIPLRGVPQMEKPTLLEKYRKLRHDFESYYSESAPPPNQLWSYQELVYRIGVLEVCQLFVKAAPFTDEMATLVPHYKELNTYIDALKNERCFPIPNEDAQKKLETAWNSLNAVIEDYRRRFASYAPRGQEQYQRDIERVVAAVLPAWIQFRNTMIEITPREEVAA